MKRLLLGFLLAAGLVLSTGCDFEDLEEINISVPGLSHGSRCCDYVVVEEPCCGDSWSFDFWYEEWWW